MMSALHRCLGGTKSPITRRQPGKHPLNGGHPNFCFECAWRSAKNRVHCQLVRSLGREGKRAEERFLYISIPVLLNPKPVCAHCPASA